MPEFSPSSKAKLETCHPLLQKLANEVIKVIDCTVAYGYRSEEEQNEACRAGKSTKLYPNSKHNQNPSLAMDLVPFVKSATWETRQAYYFAGRVKEIANRLGIPIITGADWDDDNDVNDQTLYDPCHFELKEA